MNNYHILLAVVVAQLPGLPPAPYFADATPEPPTFAITSRVVHQDQGDWDVQYRLTNVSSVAHTITPDAVDIAVSGWLSNSAVPGHVRPRHAHSRILGNAGPTAAADVIVSPDDSAKCAEVIAVWLAVDHAGDPATLWPERAGEPRSLGTLTVPPGDTLAVRLRLAHHHEIYGRFEPLLGIRSLTLILGDCKIDDEVRIDREQYRALPKNKTETIPESYLDDGFFFSAPDSLALDSGFPGHQYYRFQEFSVRRNTRMRLSLRYYIAKGIDGKLMARIAQYRESTLAWKPISEGAWEGELKVQGKWTCYDRIFTTESEATTLALDFRIANSDFGIVHLDDIRLEIVGEDAVHP